MSRMFSSRTVSVNILRMLIVAVILLFQGTVAQAEEGADPPSSGSVEDPDAAAKNIYAAGEQLYRSGKYKEALVQFRQGYRLSERPDFIFNIAKCLEALGRNREAASEYRRFAEKTEDADEAQKARDKAKDLEDQNPPAPPEPEATLPTTSGSDSSSPPPPSPPPPPTKRPRILTGLLMSLGGIGLGGGGISLAVANSRYDDLLKSCMQRCDPNMMGTVTEPRNVGISMMVGGGVFVVLGIVSAAKGY